MYKLKNANSKMQIDATYYTDNFEETFKYFTLSFSFIQPPQHYGR